MKSDLARIMFLVMPLSMIVSIVVHPTSSMILASVLTDSIPLVLCWGFDSDIAKWEKKHFEEEFGKDASD